MLPSAGFTDFFAVFRISKTSIHKNKGQSLDLPKLRPTDKYGKTTPKHILQRQRAGYYTLLKPFRAQNTQKSQKS